MRRQLSVKKKAAMAAVTTLILAAGFELAGRAIFFHKKSGHTLFAGYLIEEVNNRRAKEEAKKFVKARHRAEEPAPALPPDKAGEGAKTPGALAYPEGLPATGYRDKDYTLSDADVLALYEKIFQRFAEVCAEHKITLIVIHAPDPWTPPATGQFFGSICAKRSVPYADLSAEFRKYPIEATHLMPFDPHLSPFGQRLFATAAAEKLKPLLDHRSEPLAAKKMPKQFGDNGAAKADAVDTQKITYQYSINNQGLRAKKEYAINKDPKVVRVLCVGDSFTFGHYVSDDMTYPSQLQKLLPQAEVINAGVPGYALCDELAYLENRGIYLSPDIIILEVLINDISGLQPVWQKKMCRQLRVPEEPAGEFCWHK